MVSSIRSAFNSNFTEEKYQEYIKELNAPYPNELEFRVAETPVFCDKAFKEKILSACEHIVDVIVSPTFKEESAKAIPKELNVPGESAISNFIAFDFGLCENERGELEPQLIEMQGFPTMFAFQLWQDEAARKVFDIPANYESYLNGFNKDTYTQLLKEILLNGHPSENVILLEIFPEKQKTRIDFFFTKDYTGVKQVCLTSLIKKGNKLFYSNNGVETEIKRIYNRVIFDDLQQQSPEVQEKGKILFEDLDVEWVPHPNWFFRISKYTLPFLRHQFVPETRFLNEIGEIPSDLENYVLKPLFSFAGQGVVIDLTKDDIDKVTDPENWILQQKVKYADVIVTPDGPAKAEIRIFYFWKDGEPRPIATNNLARISKGKMIGVRYNKDKTWVGGTLAYFEK
ncbi:hypothetical protein [Segetibacter sp.]|jgi:hypothetical protein|uniref:hypothetical protein n=1 Tax=Segetibacter sp. TaxID=2231182 RepID=UPI0026366D96|nr:hypothetical protein [Segetibacter sp.]MCW3080328.1 hypothetical protein [Segetibacter sp.]